MTIILPNHPTELIPPTNNHLTRLVMIILSHNNKSPSIHTTTLYNNNYNSIDRPSFSLGQWSSSRSLIINFLLCCVHTKYARVYTTYHTIPLPHLALCTSSMLSISLAISIVIGIYNTTIIVSMQRKSSVLFKGKSGHKNV